ncbi:olfactory receptor 5V1-like [Pelobates fuscus]|uniref:olfactory receptor 5V1-like n=1 Tax=Pelobates fuscus TaxID=191477 RepID=UPI002FE43016
MQVTNQTFVTEFFLLGFQNLQNFKIPFYLILLFSYIVATSGNLLIIYLVASNSNLRCPMYFFLTQLSISDILMTTNIVPNTLYIVWGKGGTMSFAGCLTQFYCLACSLASECLLLSIMAYDRFLAICKPLRYGTLMTTGTCINLASIMWLISFSTELIVTISIIQLQYCGPNVIDHFFCDSAPLLELSCSDTYFTELEIFTLGSLLTFSPLICIIISYLYIVLAVLRLSATRRRKAFSTCSSHLTVVSMFYGTLIGNYLLPIKGQSLTLSKFVSLLYTVMTPMINPIIYSLRNKDIKEAISKHFNKVHE